MSRSEESAQRRTDEEKPSVGEKPIGVAAGPGRVWVAFDKTTHAPLYASAAFGHASRWALVRDNVGVLEWMLDTPYQAAVDEWIRQRNDELTAEGS